MNTNMINMLNVSLGMKGISNIGSKGVSAKGASFNDIFSQAVGMAADTNVSSEIVSDEAVSEEKTITFAELTAALKEKVSAAGEDVINAAIKLIQSVGKAVEALMGESGTGNENSEKADDVSSIFGIIANMVPNNAEENSTESQAMQLLSDIAAVLKTGLEDEELNAEDIVNQLKVTLETDDEENALADAVVTVLCALSSMNITDDTANEGNISEDAIGKLSAVIDTAVKDFTPNKLEHMTNIIKGDVQPMEDSSPVKFADYIAKPIVSEPSVSDNLSASIGNGLSNLRINDASQQLNSIKPAMVKSDNSLNAEVIHAEVMLNQPQATPQITSESGTATDVYSELGDLVYKQLTQQIQIDIPDASDFSGIKELTVVLKPESLGEIAVKLVADSSGVVSVVLAASNAEVGKAMSQNAAALTESFAKQNIEVSTVNVVNPSEASAYMGLDFTNQGFNRKNDGDGSENSSGSGRNSVSGINSDISAADDIRAEKLLKEAKLWATA